MGAGVVALRALLTCALLWAGQFPQAVNPLQRVIEEVRVEFCEDYGGHVLAVSRRLLLETQTDGAHVETFGAGDWKPLKKVRLRIESGPEVPLP